MDVDNLFIFRSKVVIQSGPDARQKGAARFLNSINNKLTPDLLKG
jgi:hypothetical protein